MGIESREYLYGDDNGSFGGSPTTPMSVVTKIVIITAVVFVLQLFTSGGNGQASTVTQWMVLRGQELFGGQVWRLLSYAFVHSTSNILHIVFNMYLLYIFGRVTSQLTGEREFVWFYCVSAIFAGICSVCFYRILNADPAILGASGAVMAVFTLFAMHYPRQKMLLFFVLPIEIRWLLAGYVAFESFPVLRDLSRGQLLADGGVAHSAHLGGLLFGWLYFRWNMRITAWWDRLTNRTKTVARVKKAGLKVYNPESQPDPDLSDRVDEILAKISEHGEESLTARERRILRQASEQMKKRR